MKATEQYFPLILSITLFKVVLFFESMDEILQCGRSNESYRAALFCILLYNKVHGDLNSLYNVLAVQCGYSFQGT